MSTTHDTPTGTRDTTGQHHVAARRRVGSVHARLAEGGQALPVRLWDGTRLGPHGAPYTIVLRHPWSLRAMLWPGTDLAVGEAYLDDVFDVEGSMVAALRDVARLGLDGLTWPARIALGTDVLRLPRPPTGGERGGVAPGGRRAHSPERDRQVVQHHYDVGNDFYRLFLDDGLVYSCGYLHPDDDAPPGVAADAALDRAQQRKLELVCRKLGLRPGMRLLDVGCGWGALVLHAAEHHGVEAVGITLAEQQAALARERAAERGLADRVEVRVADYREVEGTFDAIASVGMVEHVGAGMLPTYFERLRGLLRPAGRLLNHGITTGRRQQVRDLAAADDSFVGRYVFPDGALVPSSHVVARAEEAGFEVLDLQQLRPHYARTLEHWVHRLERRAEAARELAGERRYRTWRAYMAGSVVGFESGDLGVVQLLCQRDGRPPLHRDWLHAER